MSTAQFKKKTTHLDIPRRVYDLYQHVVKTCPFCNLTKPRPDRSRVSGFRAEEFGELIILDHGSTNIVDKTFGFLIVLNGATSHVRGHLHQKSFPNFVSGLDTFQMNPKAICADVAFHHPHDTQAFYRMHNVKILPTGPHTPWPNRAEIGARLFKKFLPALVDTASNNLDRTTLSQITPAQLMRKAATVINTQVTLSGKAYGVKHGKEARDLMNPASMNPEQLTSISTKQNFLNREIQKLAMKTHLEIRQREAIRRDFTEQKSLYLQIFGWEKVCFTGKKIRARFSKDEHLENG